MLDGARVGFQVDTVNEVVNKEEVIANGASSDTWYTNTNPCRSKSWVYKYNTNTANISVSKKN